LWAKCEAVLASSSLREARNQREHTFTPHSLGSRKKLVRADGAASRQKCRFECGAYQPSSSNGFQKNIMPADCLRRQKLLWVMDDGSLKLRTLPKAKM